MSERAKCQRMRLDGAYVQLLCIEILIVDSAKISRAHRLSHFLSFSLTSPYLSSLLPYLSHTTQSAPSHCSLRGFETGARCFSCLRASPDEGFIFYYILSLSLSLIILVIFLIIRTISIIIICIPLYQPHNVADSFLFRLSS